MIELNSKLLKSLGIDLESTDEKSLLQQIKSKLDERVGIATVELLDDDEITEFMDLDNAQKTTWLESNLPEYKEVIEDEFDILMGEIANDSDLFALV